MSRRRSAPKRKVRSFRSKSVWIPGVILAVGLLFAGASLAYGAHLEESDAFCASCHTQPETKYFQRRLQNPATDLANFHYAKGVKCIDCHSGGGVVGRVQGEMVGAKDLAAFLTHTDVQPAVLTVPIGDGNCLKCHGNVEATQDFNRHFHAFLPRWQAIDPNAASCVDCHSSHTTDGSPSLQFLEQNRTEQVCNDCHRALRG